MAFRSRRRPDPGLIVFTPLPPARNGIADYCAELLPALAVGCDVQVVVDDHAPVPEVPAGCRVLRLAEYELQAERLAGLPHLYQLGNNADHVYMLPWLARRPGVVVLHDVSLHHLVDQATLRWDDRQAYDAMLELEHGEHGRRLAAAFRRSQRRPRAMFYEVPMTREILAQARTVVVHSLYAALKVKAQRPEVPVVHVRHHATQAALQAGRSLSREEARTALGIAEDTQLLVSLGFVTKSKQVDTVLRYLARHRQTRPRLRYVIAGQHRPEDYDVCSMISGLGLSDIVQITGYVDEPAFYRHVRAADVVVNLRYPSGGETSGTLVRALAAGACVVVNDIGPFSEFPDEVCAKVPMRSDRHDADFDRVLTELIDNPGLRRRLGDRAARYAAGMHSLSRSAERYRHALDTQSGATAATGVTLSASMPPNRTEALLAALPAGDRLAVPTWATVVPIPVRVRGSEDMERVLCLGLPAPDVSWLQRLFGYPSECIDLRPAPLPQPWNCGLTPRAHGLALLQLDLPDPAVTLPPWLAVVNGALALQGTLLLTTRSLPGGAQARSMVTRLLVAAGFVVEAAAAHRDDASFALDDVSGDADEAHAACWLGRKVSESDLPANPGAARRP